MLIVRMPNWEWRGQNTVGGQGTKIGGQDTASLPKRPRMRLSRREVEHPKKRQQQPKRTSRPGSDQGTTPTEMEIPNSTVRPSSPAETGAGDRGWRRWCG